jgi:hypothetical protein
VYLVIAFTESHRLPIDNEARNVALVTTSKGVVNIFVTHAHQESSTECFCFKQEYVVMPREALRIHPEKKETQTRWASWLRLKQLIRHSVIPAESTSFRYMLAVFTSSLSLRGTRDAGRPWWTQC